MLLYLGNTTNVWVVSSMVEQWPLKPLVLGSSPRRPTKLRHNKLWLRLASHYIAKAKFVQRNSVKLDAWQAKHNRIWKLLLDN